MADKSQLTDLVRKQVDAVIDQVTDDLRPALTIAFTNVAMAAFDRAEEVFKDVIATARIAKATGGDTNG